jgi:hypothetical protein
MILWRDLARQLAAELELLHPPSAGTAPPEPGP